MDKDFNKVVNFYPSDVRGLMKCIFVRCTNAELLDSEDEESNNIIDKVYYKTLYLHFIPIKDMEIVFGMNQNDSVDEVFTVTNCKYIASENLFEVILESEHPYFETEEEYNNWAEDMKRKGWNTESDYPTPQMGYWNKNNIEKGEIIHNILK